MLRGRLFLLTLVAMLTFTTQAVAAPDEAYTADVVLRTLRAVEVVNTDTANFAAVARDWIDGRYGLTIYYTGQNAGRSSVESVLPSDVPVRWVEALYSRAELEEVVEAIVEEMSPSHRDLSLAALVPLIDVIDVETYGNVQEVSAALSSYGDVVRVKSVPMPVGNICSYRWQCTPWRGGIQIYRTAYNVDGCSWGFQGKIGSAYQMITAGHCSTYATWKHNGITIGSTSMNALAFSLGVDVQRVTVSGPNFYGDKNLVYLTNATKSFTLTAYRPESQIALNDEVRVLGSNSGLIVGRITALNSYYYLMNNPYDPDQLLHGFRHDAVMQGGDSGAPVVNYATHHLFGFHSSQTGYFATAEDTDFALGLDKFCLSASC